MPVEINETSVLQHLKTDRVPLETLLAGLNARGGKRLTQLFYVILVLMEHKRISMDLRPLQVFECPICNRTLTSERAREQHRAAKHPGLATGNEHISALGIPLDDKPHPPRDPKMAGASCVVVTEKPVLDRCPQCGQATVKRITVPWRDGATKIRSWCTNPECGYKDEDTS